MQTSIAYLVATRTPRPFFGASTRLWSRHEEKQRALVPFVRCSLLFRHQPHKNTVNMLGVQFDDPCCRGVVFLRAK